MSFASLQREHELANTVYFRCMQVRHALKSNLPEGTSPLESYPLEDRLLDGYLPEKAISLTYKKLINNTADPLGPIRERWEGDGLELDDEEWQEVVACPQEVAISSR